MRVMKLPRCAMPGNVDGARSSGQARGRSPGFEKALREATREGKTLFTLRGALDPQQAGLDEAADFEDDGCPICVSMREMEARGEIAPEELMGEAGGLAWSARPIDLSGPQAAELMDAHRALARPGDALSMVPLTVPETAELLARELLGVRALLDRHRRFSLQLWHPTLGPIHLEGSLKGERMKVLYSAPGALPEAMGQLREARAAIAESLSEEGLTLVSFLPERVDAR